METEPLEIPEVIVIKPKRFVDERGWFLESYNAHEFKKATGLHPKFVQDNHTKSKMGVFRGLHFQVPPKAQSKLVRVVRGCIFDVAVDIRRSSSTFGQFVSWKLSEENQEQLWVPEGFAHGFLTLSDTAEVLYTTTGHYAPETERTICWKDPQIGIEWPFLPSYHVSERDSKGLSLSEALVFFE